MFNLSILKRYIFADFLKITFNVFLVFFSLGIILNLFEEINFFKDYDVGVMLPLIICFLKVPNLIFNLFPFIVLISSVWLFLKMIRTDELTAMRVAGTSNADIILMPSILAFIMGIIFVVGLNPVTSTLTQKYFSIKGNYTQNNDYLAAITVNGIWIKEKNQSKINIIRSSSLQKSTLLEVSIYQFDENYNPLNRIEAESANIQNKNWVLSNVRIFQKDENVKVANFKELEYSSAYDLKSIKDLYSNLETVSFWNLKELIKLYEERG
jgi:lipopolysaccharide export system permease protein